MACRRPHHAARGFALMAALLAVLAVSLAAAVAVSRARLDAQREKERQLLWFGNQFRQALQSYQAALPLGGKAQLPMKLDDLLEDKRFPRPLRHLRRLYPDPFTGHADWVLERSGDRIIGLHSSSTDVPIHLGMPPTAGSAPEPVRTYADWHFLATDPVQIGSALPALASTGGSNGGDGNPGTPGSPDGGPPAVDTPPPPPPDLIAQARAQCYAKYGVPSITCHGPNFAMGTDGPSCRREMASLLDQCIAAAGNP